MFHTARWSSVNSSKWEDQEVTHHECETSTIVLIWRIYLRMKNSSIDTPKVKREQNSVIKNYKWKSSWMNFDKSAFALPCGKMRRIQMFVVSSMGRLRNVDLFSSVPSSTDAENADINKLLTRGVVAWPELCKSLTTHWWTEGNSCSRLRDFLWKIDQKHKFMHINSSVRSWVLYKTLDIWSSFAFHLHFALKVDNMINHYL